MTVLPAMNNLLYSNVLYNMCGSWIVVGRYGWLVDGTAQARIERFEAEQHSFGEYTAVSFNSIFYMFTIYYM